MTAVWLSPIFKSPMADFGYDIADFYDIQPEYGTIDDLDRMISQATYLGIKIFLDFVPNHSSDENIWFEKSVDRVPGFEDFYIWHPGYPDPKDPSKRLPPNNWISVFRKSAWAWNEKRQEFYFHQFVAKQPDLNYRNPAVVAEMKVSDMTISIWYGEFFMIDFSTECVAFLVGSRCGRFSYRCGGAFVRNSAG